MSFTLEHSCYNLHTNKWLMSQYNMLTQSTTGDSGVGDSGVGDSSGAPSRYSITIQIVATFLRSL